MDICYISGLMEPLINVIEEITLRNVVQWITDIIMVFGGVVPYIPQYKKICIKENADGFSLYVCLSLLLANILRILFWFGKRYELPLLFQSIVMNIMMLTMIHLCVKVRKNGSQTTDRVFTDFDLKYFWKWTDFQSYVEFLLAVCVTLSLLTLLLQHLPIYIEFIGFLALLIEAMLAVPQLWKNLRSRSTKGMSIVMVLMWTTGDAFKSIYFVIRKAPMQFWVCGILQVVIDIIILGQVYWYRK